MAEKNGKPNKNAAREKGTVQKMAAGIAAGLMVLQLMACDKQRPAGPADAAALPGVQIERLSERIASRTASVSFSPEGASVSGEGVTVRGNRVVVERGGTYVLGGAGVGSVETDAENVVLVLDGLELTAPSGAAVSFTGALAAIVPAVGTRSVLTGAGCAVSAAAGLTVTGAGALKLISTGDGIRAGALSVSGGFVSVSASDACLNVSGPIAMTAGTMLLSGSESGASPVLSRGFGVTGGLLIASGQADSIAVPDGKQSSVLAVFPEHQSAGTLAYLADTEGEVVAAYRPSCGFSGLLVSSPALRGSGIYFAYLGGSPAGEEVDGLCDSAAGGKLTRQMSVIAAEKSGE